MHTDCKTTEPEPLPTLPVDVVKFLRMLTVLPLDEVAAIEASMQASFGTGFVLRRCVHHAVPLLRGLHVGDDSCAHSPPPSAPAPRVPTVAMWQASVATLAPALPSQPVPQAPGYVANTAQRRLAEEVTRFVHGEEGLQQAIKATEALAPGAGECGAGNVVWVLG